MLVASDLDFNTSRIWSGFSNEQVCNDEYLIYVTVFLQHTIMTIVQYQYSNL